MVYSAIAAFSVAWLFFKYGAVFNWLSNWQDNVPLVRFFRIVKGGDDGRGLPQAEKRRVAIDVVKSLARTFSVAAAITLAFIGKLHAKRSASAAFVFVCSMLPAALEIATPAAGPCVIGTGAMAIDSDVNILGEIIVGTGVVITVGSFLNAVL